MDLVDNKVIIFNRKLGQIIAFCLESLKELAKFSIPNYPTVSLKYGQTQGGYSYEWCGLINGTSLVGNRLILTYQSALPNYYIDLFDIKEGRLMKTITGGCLGLFKHVWVNQQPIQNCMVVAKNYELNGVKAYQYHEIQVWNFSPLAPINFLSPIKLRPGRGGRNHLAYGYLLVSVSPISLIPAKSSLNVGYTYLDKTSELQVWDLNKGQCIQKVTRDCQFREVDLKQGKASFFDASYAKKIARNLNGLGKDDESIELTLDKNKKWLLFKSPSSNNQDSLSLTTSSIEQSNALTLGNG